MEVFENGDRLIAWESPLDLHAHGHLALPHYMGRDDEAMDQERYQTVFSKEEGAIAAPTAGLHFTPEMLDRIRHDFITLHVGVGTFRPVSVDHIKDHVMHSEKYSVTAGDGGKDQPRRPRHRRGNHRHPRPRIPRRARKHASQRRPANQVPPTFSSTRPTASRPSTGC